MMITFNHERFVDQALASAINQRTNFNYEIVVGEDASTDGTREVVERYARQYPDRIRLLPSGPNLGMIRNFVRTYKACGGEYVALLEGDDFWTSDRKLQTQVDLLDRRPDCVMCCHPVEVRDESEAGRRCPHRNIFPVLTMSEWSLEEHLAESYIPTCSAVARNRVFGEFPDWFFNLGMADYTFHALNAQHGKIVLLPEIMGIYRLHSGGVWSSATAARRHEHILKAFATINRHFAYRYDHILVPSAVRHRYAMAEQYRFEGEMVLSREEMQKARTELMDFYSRPFRKNRWTPRTLKLALRVFSPTFFHRLLYGP